MNSKRTPFQFSSIDPAKRQAELRKRFGLPAKDMIFDFMNPSTMGAVSRDKIFSSGNSDQQRVPKFNQGSDERATLANNVDGYKPKVRMIPIQVEGVDGTISRHRTHSGPSSLSKGAELKKGAQVHNSDTFLSDSVKDSLSGETASKPKVSNIPIQIEPRDIIKESITGKPKEKPKSVFQSKVKSSEAEKERNVEKVTEHAPSCEKPQNPDNSIPLKQIECVLNKFKTYSEEVEKFSGSARDKQYRYLDEMLTRCMLDLDNVDTLGLNEIRQSRKAAIKKVQASIDLLEEKINQDSKKSKLKTSESDVKDELEIVEAKIKPVSGENIGMKDLELNNPSSLIIQNTSKQFIEDVEVDDGSHSSSDVEGKNTSKQITDAESVIEKETIESCSTNSADLVVNSDNTIEIEDPSNSSADNFKTSATEIKESDEDMQLEATETTDQCTSSKNLMQDVATVPSQNSDMNEQLDEFKSSSSKKMDVLMSECPSLKSEINKSSLDSLTNDSEHSKNVVKLEIDIQEEDSSANDNELVLQPVVTEPSESNDAVISEKLVNDRTKLDLPVIKEGTPVDEDIEISEL